MDLQVPAQISDRFDYSLLHEEQRVVVTNAAAGIRSVYRRSIPEIGKHLIAAKAVLPHGLFQDWALTELDIPPRSASRMIAVATFLEGKSATLAELPPTVLYKLAAPKTDTAAVAEIVEAASAGTLLPPKEIEQRLFKAEQEAFEVSLVMQRSKKLTPDQAKKRLAAQRAKYDEEREREWATEQQRDEQKMRALRPLAGRIASKLGPDVEEVLDTLSNWQTCALLVKVLQSVIDEHTNAKSANDTGSAP